MVVVAHEAPREDRPAVKIPHTSEVLDKLGRFAVVVEDELTSCHSAVHVVDPVRQEKAGASRHEISPMRGRDTSSLPVGPRRSKCGSVYVAPIIHPSISRVTARTR